MAAFPRLDELAVAAKSRIGYTTTSRGLPVTGTTGLVVGQRLGKGNIIIPVRGDYLIGLGVRSTTAAGLAGGSIATRTITVPEVIDDCLSLQHTDSSEDETDPPATHETRSLTSKSLTKPIEKGVGLRVADSYTGNHLEDGFTPLKTIQRLLVIIGRRSYSGFEWEAFKLERRVLQYFKVYISRLNPFGCAKLTTFIIMCKAYGCEPSVDLFRVFFNLCRAGSWLTFQKRSKKHIPNLLPKVITRIEGWHERFFFVQDFIITYKYPQLLLDENMLNSKSFKDKLPLNIDENPYFQRLGRYPISVHVLNDPILFLAGLKPSWEFSQQCLVIIMGSKEMAFRNFIYTEDDDDLAFLPKEPSPGFGTGSPSASVNTELPKDVEEPEVQPAEITAESGESLKAGVFIVHPGSVAARIKERKCKMREGSSRPLVKRKLASESSSSRVVRAKTSASKDDAPILSISDDDEGLPYCFKLKDANACHLKILAITPPAWKGHLDNQIDLELLDLHDRCYARHVVVDNAVNKRSHEFLQVIEKMRGEADVIKARERSCEEECEELRVKYEAAGYQVTLSTLELKVDSLEVEKARLEAVEVSLRREVEKLKQDRRDVVSKVVPYAAIELVHSDELGKLAGTLVSSAITYRRCRAYEQVVAMKEPFDLSKANGYRSSYKKEHTQASNDFSTATFPWLDEFIADAATPIEALLSNKPPTLQKPAPSRTQMHVPSS
nr:hypothetical protein [Tanacetum cinerariifolium]